MRHEVPALPIEDEGRKGRVSKGRNDGMRRRGLEYSSVHYLLLVTAGAADGVTTEGTAG